MNENDAEIERALDAYHHVRRFEIDDRQHGVVMAMADLLIYATRSNIDVPALLEEARWLVAESTA